MYVYGLFHPVTREIRYVGKTYNISKRFQHHRYKSKDTKTHVYSWWKSLGDLEPVIQILSKYDSEEQAFLGEISKKMGGRPFVDQFGTRYETLGEAVRAHGLDKGNVSKVLKGRVKQTKGFVFKYLEESQS
jgi:hypothetical protein